MSGASQADVAREETRAPNRPMERLDPTRSNPAMVLPILLTPLLTLTLPQDEHAELHPLDDHEHDHELHAEDAPPVQLGLVVDTEVRWLDADEDDGLELNLRTLELGANGQLAPAAWAYGSLAVHDGEVELEEAAIRYRGLGEDTGLRAGRFYVDFGRQMQRHVDELPYPDRPLVLRTFLGEELAGNGLELSRDFHAGGGSSFRLSLAAFDSLAFDEEHGHGHEHGDEDELEIEAPERGDLDELSYAVRLTHLLETSEHAAFQWGLSARRVGSFGLGDEENGLDVEDLANTVYGFDLGYGWRDEAHGSGWSLGAEWLLASGELAGEVVDDGGGPELEVFDDEVMGHYLWLERRFDHDRAAGLLWSVADPLEEDADEERELVLYHTRHAAENLRLRFAVSHLERGDGDDEFALVVQLTGFLGPHSHGPHGHAVPSRYDLDR